MSFNTQPPKGGWVSNVLSVRCLSSFNTQPPKGGWRLSITGYSDSRGFNTQPPKGGWIGEICLLQPTETFQHTAA